MFIRAQKTRAIYIKDGNMKIDDFVALVLEGYGKHNRAIVTAYGSKKNLELGIRPLEIHQLAIDEDNHT